jgi:hypothetical protein
MIRDNPKLWKVENYEKFLEARLKLMWERTQEMLQELAR